MCKSPIVIIGAGPSGLMAAQHLAQNGFDVHIYEQNKAAARKFLVAGHGGFNLTHNEPIELFVNRYDKSILHLIIQNFDNKATINWLQDLGIETYVGSSGKIFPVKTIKPIQVLNAWLNRLNSLGVKIFYEHKFVDFNDKTVEIEERGQRKSIPYYKLLLALGGGSWSKTGSNAKWVDILSNKGIDIIPLQAANSGYETVEDFKNIEGQNLKNITVKFNDISKKGELVFTNYGIEGSPIYYLNRFTRHTQFPYTIFIDLKPNLSEKEIITELQKQTNTTKVLKEKLNISSVALQLLKRLPKESFVSPILLSQLIKNYPITVCNFRPIDEVISTAGGVSFDAIDTSLSLKKYPNIYCIGEMLDWEAPTGGYLLQACFSLGVYTADAITKEPKNHK